MRALTLDLLYVRPRSDFNTEVDTNAFPMTDEQSRAVCRKIDRVILPILMCVLRRGFRRHTRSRSLNCSLSISSHRWVYFLQILDKSVVGYGAVLGLREDAGLVGNQCVVAPFLRCLRSRTAR